jgi:hypothetical protein
LVGITLNPVYLFAAGHGQPSAQSALAIGCCDHAVRIADDNPELADEYFMAAEILAELACAHANPSDIAKLAGIFTARSLHSALVDPVRSLEYREKAEELFESVERSGDNQALGIIAYALNHLADADPDDDRASDRLNRIIGTLPAGEAQLLREAVRTATHQAQEVL